MLNYKHFNTGYDKLCLECITIKFIRKWFISNLLQAIKFSGSLTSIANHFIDAINICSFCKNSFSNINMFANSNDTGSIAYLIFLTSLNLIQALVDVLADKTCLFLWCWLNVVIRYIKLSQCAYYDIALWNLSF